MSYTQSMRAAVLLADTVLRVTVLVTTHEIPYGQKYLWRMIFGGLADFLSHHNIKSVNIAPTAWTGGKGVAVVP